MRELAKEWERQDTHQICHHFGSGGDDDALEGENVVCRGFYETQFLEKGTGQLLRIAARLNLIEFVEPPPSIGAASRKES